ncbi:GH92 family glycosyl hydrolase [Flavobacterium sp. '19STA2R22 D10 B1']|uniref:GH92 family glycosyl hydrolase n=1 Tax=Flavobacterium aerium TaxID=3037261 RepID=UPI00278C681D|nr:GH92 family glycosyl hydrolase [Flavobacterium sp. '19STA2R22 D10 B1']
MQKQLTSYFILVLLCFGINASAQQNYAQYVNPMIGTGGHGHTFPGATVPFGMVQLSPDTRIDGSWDGCSGYHYSDNVIYGFSHTHLNGTGVSDYGDILLMPTMGEPQLMNTEYASAFSHKNEQASAGYYAVKLDKHNIDVALTTSTRVGFHEYTFNESGVANIILDLNHRDKLLEGEVRIVNDKVIEVLRRSEAWARDQYVFARIEFDQPMKINKVKTNGKGDFSSQVFSGTELALSFSKTIKKGDKILVKVALSPTGYEGATKNMKAEIPNWDFNATRKAVVQMWNNELGKIEVKSSDKEKLTIFYTALYHVMTQPNTAMDVDGQYRGRDNKLHRASGFTYYSVFSLWDTFRAAHPLYTLIDKKRTSDFVSTFLKQYEQGGRLPVWELASNETDCMIGYHSVSVMADAMAKGIKGFDYEKAFEASKHSAMLDHLGLDAYKKNGFISLDDEHESVSKTVEYAYDDWCIAQMALMLGKKEEYAYFMKRAQNWKNIFDPVTGFMRPKKNGGWVTPFDAREVNNNFTEGNSWQYTFFVPQDVQGLINAYGGPVPFEKKLDEMFSSPSATTGREQVDITGLIGQYAHGNEPSHHMAYLYNYVGKPEKTTQKVHQILNEFYKNTPDGLIGNEDCGQMSAWYVLSSMGLYAVTPGIPEWNTTVPYFENIKVHFEDGTTKEITPKSTAAYLRFFGLNPKPESQKLEYEEIVPVPVIETTGKVFKDKLKIELKAMNASDDLYYCLEEAGKKKKEKVFIPYSKPLEITETTTVYAYAKKASKQSAVISGTFYKKGNDWKINIISKYNPQYHAGGDEGLIDGVLGEENWRKGEWQGYQSQDFECIIDLKSKQMISEISARFLQDSRSWILMPTTVEYYVSKDNKKFKLVKRITNTLDPKEEKISIHDFKAEIKPIKGQYIMVKAYNFGKLPDWHQGAGGDAFLFIDEITVK